MTQLVGARVTWAVVGVAAAMAAMTLIPAEVWTAPRNDATYSGFDPNLVYADAGAGGSVDVRSDSLSMVGRPASDPSANLITTPLDRVAVSISVTVVNSTDAMQPFQIGWWSPRSGDAYVIFFGPAPANQVVAEVIEKGSISRFPVGGHVVRSTPLGTYTTGSASVVTLTLDKKGGVIEADVSPPASGPVSDSVKAAELPGLFSSSRLALTAWSFPSAGSSSVELHHYSATLGHQRWWAARVSDARVDAILAVLGVAGLVLLVYLALAWRRSHRLRITWPAAPPRLWAWLAIAVAAYFAGNALLFQLGGHPFDMTIERFYGYVTRSYGIVDLYYLPNVTSLAYVSGGIPSNEFPFPYGPLMAALATVWGWTNSALFVGGGSFSVASTSLEYLIKAISVMCGLADAGLIYLILRELNLPYRWRLVGAALFLFNPALWFNMSIWGQTQVVSIFFVLACVLMVEKRQPFWAWLALLAACLTRPQMLVFALLLGVVLLSVFPLRETVPAMSTAIIVTFIALLPLSWFISPSLPVDVLVNNFRIQEGGGNDLGLTTVSQDAYSIWPLVTLIFNGASGINRAFTPSSTVAFASLTYQRIGQLLTIAVLLVTCAAIWYRSRRSTEPGGYLPLVALGIVSFVMLTTGILAMYFLLALPFLLLCQRWMGPTAFLFVAVVWTVTTLVPMYGDMAVAISGNHYSLLSAQNNVLTRVVIYLYSWDRFITLGVAADICAFAWLGWLALRRPRQAIAAA